jgi:hypothetical protein
MIDWLLVDYGETISTPFNSGAVNELWQSWQGKTRPSFSGATGTHAPTTTSASRRRPTGLASCAETRQIGAPSSPPSARLTCRVGWD